MISPDLEVIPEEIADQAKMMILNFPGIPFQQWLMKISLKSNRIREKA